MSSFEITNRLLNRVFLRAVPFIFMVLTSAVFGAQRYEIDGYSIETFDGRDRGAQFSGAWVDVRGLKVDERLLKSKIGFEFSSRYDEDYRFSMGVSSFRTFFPSSSGSWSERNHAQLGDRFWINMGPSRVNNLSETRRFYRSLSSNDKQFFEATCHLIGNKAFMAEVRAKLMESGRGTDFTFRNFWGSHKRAVQMAEMGELCLKSIGQSAQTNSELLIGSRLYKPSGSTSVLKTVKDSAPSSSDGSYRACVTWEEKPDIKNVQQALKDMGYYFGPINGSLGSQACAALRKYAEKSTSNPSYFTVSETEDLYKSIRQPRQVSSQESTEKFCGINVESVQNFTPSKPEDVKRVQAGLRSKGFLWGAVDGVAGPQTCKAFISYIAAEGKNGSINTAAFLHLISVGQTALQNVVKTDSPSSKDKAQSENTDAIGKTAHMTDSDRKKLLGQIEQLEAQIKTLEREVQVAKGESNYKKINDLAMQKTNLEKENKQLSYQAEGLKSEVQQLKDKVKLLELRIDSLNKDLAQTKSDEGEIEEIRAKRDSLAKVIAGKDQLLTTLRESLRSKDAEIARQQRDLDSLSSGDQTRASMIESLNKRLSDAAIELTLAAQDRQLAERQSKSFETELLNARSELMRLAARNQTLEAEIAAIQNQPQMTAELEAEKRRTYELEKNNQELEGRLTVLEKELASYRAAEARKTDWIDDLSPEWRKRLADMPVQQRQFCNIANEFRKDLEDARSSRNQIRINMTFQERQQSLDSLLPDGDFRDWIVRVISVGQMSDGSARFVAEMPCKTMIGSGVVGRGKDASWIATIEHKSRMYRELAKVSAGDFIAVQGGLLEIEAFEPGQPESFYGVNQIGDNPHPEVKALGLEGELFISRVDYLIMLRQ